MNLADDPLRPPKTDLSHVETISRSTWQGLLASAHDTTHLPPGCCEIKSTLHRTPSIPGSAHAVEKIVKKSIFLEGHATWTTSPPERSSSYNCDLPGTKKTPPRKVYIGESRPAVCSLSDDYFKDWPGLQPLPTPAGNLLALFVLGWSYVLSARLIELRRKTDKDKVCFTEDLAQIHVPHDRNGGDEYFNLDTQSGSAAEVRWWAAILAGGSGWHATLARGNETYFSPWECHLGGNAFTIAHDAGSLSSLLGVEPPSSAIAQEYLYKLARHQNAVDQLICAFAATLTLPAHNRFGSKIILPRPMRRNTSHNQNETHCTDQIPTFDEVPRYMAFSSTSGLLGSCLFGALFEPGIPCNMASQWIDPALKELARAISETKQPLPVIWALSERRPHLTSLWLGAMITGLLPQIIRVSMTFLPTTYLEGVTWAQSPQSFMDPANHRRATLHKNDNNITISREDEFRLLFLTDTLSEAYGHPPLCPYLPVGEVNIQDTSLGVKLHHACDHRLVYHSWGWKCQNEEELTDYGLATDFEPLNERFRRFSLPSIWIVVGIAFVFTLHRAFLTSIWTPTVGFILLQFLNHSTLSR